MTINSAIDGRKIEAQEGLTILQVAKQNNIDIPTLCHHEALEPYGACRLCTVEVIAGKKRRFVTSCNYVVSDGIDVRTASPEVTEIRKMILELLLAKCPDVKVIKVLARSYGIDKPRFKLENQTCILCGLCVRVCKEIIGANAISLVNRGTDTRIDAPFNVPSEDCIGCGACATVCPTGMIQLQYTKDEVEIKPFNTIVKLGQCTSCGKNLASTTFVGFVSKKLGSLSKLPFLCIDCKKERESLALANFARYSKNA
ncbi:MAG: (2Fe-2S)-binding protein [Phycisphaerales bacterium]|nr:MAG: (2Fe-2S)-binding protein [Phycisphaerales bacterium]